MFFLLCQTLRAGGSDPGRGTIGVLINCFKACTFSYLEWSWVRNFISGVAAALPDLDCGSMVATEHTVCRPC